MAIPIIRNASRLFLDDYALDEYPGPRDQAMVPGKNVFGRDFAGALAKRSFAEALQEERLLKKPESGDSLNEKRKVLLCL